jgi:hypothetical protein
MRVRHVIEIERVGSGDAGGDPHLLMPSRTKMLHITSIHYTARNNSQSGMRLSAALPAKLKL